MHILIALLMLGAAPQKADTRPIAKAAIAHKVVVKRCKAQLNLMSKLVTKWIPQDEVRMRLARRLHRRLHYAQSIANQRGLVAAMVPFIATCSRRKDFKSRYAFKEKRVPQFSPMDGSLLIKGAVYVAGRYWSKRAVSRFRRRFKREFKMLRQVGYSEFLFIGSRSKRSYKWTAHVKP